MSERETRRVDASAGIAGASRSSDLLEWLYELRAYQREKQGKGLCVIKGRDLPWEQNRQGKMQWYMHPALDDAVIRSMIVFIQEIPPGGRSGAQKNPGGSVIYVLEGRGYTMLDDVRYDWEAEDVVNIPIRVQGVVVQHFNADPEKPARFISADVNLVDVLGVDRGAELVQVESAPDAER